MTSAMTAGLDPRWIIVSLIAVGLILTALVLIFANNRLLFWCLVGAACLHFGAAGAYALKLWLAPKEDTVRIKIAALPTPEPLPTPKPEPTPKPTPEETRPPELPKGRQDAKKDVKKMPKGQTMRPRKREVTRNVPPPKVIATRRDNPTGQHAFVPDVPDASYERKLDEFDPTAKYDPLQEVRDIAGRARAGSGTDSGDAGDPSGEGTGEIPYGWENGKANGRVYFVRLKFGTGDWNAHSDGTRKLMKFLDPILHTEAEGRAYSAQEIRDRFLSKKKPPSFIYIRCDDSFTLTNTEATVLRNYLAVGGFLFLDSRPDPLVREHIASELSKVLAEPLQPIPNSDPINSCLFKLPVPAFGQNVIERKNYGCRRNGKLVVFYTPGNFTSFYEDFQPGQTEYVTATYQMGANVMIYGINRGNVSGITQRGGASAKITTQALEALHLIDPTGPGAAPTLKPGESVKIKRTPRPGAKPGEDEPDDIKMIDN